MIALHLHPIHNALAVRYHPLGWDGKYAIQAMVLENGRWTMVGDVAFFPRHDLEGAEDGAQLTAGQFNLSVSNSQWTIRHRGGVFGRCKAPAMVHALEAARIKATGRASGVLDQERPAPAVRGYVPIPIEDERGTDAEPVTG